MKKYLYISLFLISFGFSSLEAQVQHITICIPFADAERLTPIWAYMEKEVDFRKDAQGAARTTMSFAAMELKRCLEKAYPDVKCSFSGKYEGGRAICLEISDYLSRDGSFSIIPGDERITLKGNGRTGLLYAAYELLYLQGYNWYYPGSGGEIFSGKTNSPVFPEKRIDKKPSMPVSRSFDFEYVSMESDEFFLWMARNRMNVCVWRPNTGALCEKLGMTFKAGGHIFEAILDVDRPMPSGKTLWEEHEDWYGLPATGKRTKRTAQSTQFCVSKPGLLHFLGDELVKKLMGEYDHADWLLVWGFDTWGNSCQCDDCIKKGNGSDITVYLASELQYHLDSAKAKGELDRDVFVSMASYEGTATLEAPENPLPRNIADGVLNTYYPINRCYAHTLGDKECIRNHAYDKNMRDWLKTAGAPKFILGEYYNVSKYEDLPLVFTNEITKSIPYYHSLGVDGMTYMHVPMVNWGVRTLTQCLFARLSYDVETDVTAFLERYFLDMYGPVASLMEKYYGACEESMKYIACWAHGVTAFWDNY